MLFNRVLNAKDEKLAKHRSRDKIFLNIPEKKRKDRKNVLSERSDLQI